MVLLIISKKRRIIVLLPHSTLLSTIIEVLTYIELLHYSCLISV